MLWCHLDRYNGRLYCLHPRFCSLQGVGFRISREDALRILGDYPYRSSTPAGLIPVG
jgi:hypothetical protein